MKVRATKAAIYQGIPRKVDDVFEFDGGENHNRPEGTALVVLDEPKPSSPEVEVEELTGRRPKK